MQSITLPSITQRKSYDLLLFYNTFRGPETESKDTLLEFHMNIRYFNKQQKMCLIYDNTLVNGIQLNANK